MRWDGLFADLEAQATALERAERSAEIDDRIRGELGAIAWLARMRAAVGSPVRLTLAGDRSVIGAVARVGPDWLLVDEGAGREALVPALALRGVRGLPRYAATPDSVGVVESRLGLRHALRGIARDRSIVRIERVDAATVDGTIDRVGADFVEVAAHSAGEVRRRREVGETELVPLDALAAVRRLT